MLLAFFKEKISKIYSYPNTNSLSLAFSFKCILKDSNWRKLRHIQFDKKGAVIIKEIRSKCLSQPPKTVEQRSVCLFKLSYLERVMNLK